MADSDERTENTTTVEIPDKMYFKIGEVSQITGVKPYILRYWENEFPIINPSKRKNKHRLYRRKDVEDILLIKKLLWEEKFTIAGARMKLKEKHRLSGDSTATGSTAAPIEDTSSENTRQLNLLNESVAADSAGAAEKSGDESTFGMTTTTDRQFTIIEGFIKEAGEETVGEVIRELEQIKDLLEA